MIVLDTHAVLWWTLEPERLGAGARRAIEEAEAIGVPSIAFWEASLLVRRGRYAMDLAVTEWARHVLSIPRVHGLALTPEIALASDALEMHADPADRFIVATALALGSRLVTKDALLAALHFVRTVW